MAAYISSVLVDVCTDTCDLVFATNIVRNIHNFDRFASNYFRDARRNAGKSSCDISTAFVPF
jgi:hypothetical protein